MISKTNDDHNTLARATSKIFDYSAQEIDGAGTKGGLEQMNQKREILDRLDKVHTQLVEKTDVAQRSSAESDWLWRLLCLTEYIWEGGMENPLDDWDDWFTVEYLEDIERAADEQEKTLNLESSPTAEELAADWLPLDVAEHEKENTK